MEEARQIVETSEGQRSCHIGEIVDAEFEQENEEQQEEGIIPDETYDARIPGEMMQKQTNTRKILVTHSL